MFGISEFTAIINPNDSLIVLYPENSIEGFLKSIEIGVNTIEIDVVISHDKQVVISHEPWISSHICIDSAGIKSIMIKRNLICIKWIMLL